LIFSLLFLDVKVNTLILICLKKAAMYRRSKKQK